MKIAAVIAEYNPFHNGHKLQLDELRKNIGADYIIVVMSGDFTQRGEPAIIDKYVRCRAALECGADAVFELPVYFALASAEYFAKGAVSLIDKLGAVDYLHFGSECGDIELLSKYARILADEPYAYKERLHFHTKSGKSFPLARNDALIDIGNDAQEVNGIFKSPNNILALEYIKALMLRGSNIKPITIKRAGDGFHSSTLSDGTLPSAGAIRTSLENATRADGVFDLSYLMEYMPDASVNALRENKFIFANDFSQMLLYKLMERDGICLTDFYDMGRELSDIVGANLMNFTTLTDFAHICKRKSFTYTRICRALFHALLGMTQENADCLKSDDYCNYARLLGFKSLNSKSSQSCLLATLKNSSAIPIITSPARGLKTLKGSALISLNADIHAADIYEAVKAQKNPPSPILNELTREVVKGK